MKTTLAVLLFLLAPSARAQNDPRMNDPRFYRMYGELSRLKYQLLSAACPGRKSGNLFEDVRNAGLASDITGLEGVEGQAEARGLLLKASGETLPNLQEVDWGRDDLGVSFVMLAGKINGLLASAQDAQALRDGADRLLDGVPSELRSSAAEGVSDSVIRDEKAWDAFWTAAWPGLRCRPPVDFAKKMVVIAAAVDGPGSLLEITATEPVGPLFQVAYTVFSSGIPAKVAVPQTVYSLRVVNKTDLPVQFSEMAVTSIEKARAPRR